MIKLRRVALDKNELVKITIKEDDGSSKAYFIRSKEASCLLCNVEHIAALDGLRKYETNGSSHYTRLAITEAPNNKVI